MPHYATGEEFRLQVCAEHNTTCARVILRFAGTGKIISRAHKASAVRVARAARWAL
jgi:hypothetical protein